MLSAVFNRAGQPLVLEERPIPRPGRGQALVRVCRCGICGSDLHMTSGSAFDMPPGTALGHEYAGEVVETGTDGWLRIGDRVTALPLSACGDCPACRQGQFLHCPEFRPMAGGFSQYTLIDQRMALRLPDSLSFDDGALVEPLAAALRGIRKLEPLTGARVAVIGAGAIGASAIFWLNRLGAKRIVAIARSRRAEALATQMGASALLASGDGLAERLAAALGGPPDIVVEAAGVAGLLQQALELIRPGGTILSLGGCMTQDPILPVLAMWKEIRLIFSVAYAPEDFRLTLEALEAGAAAPHAMIGETISLAELPARFEALRLGLHVGKILVDPQS